MSEPYDDGGPIPENVGAPWSPTQVRAIQAWQEAPHVHPLTCATSEHGRLLVRSGGLYCATCGYEQTWVPWMCAETFPGDYAEPKTLIPTTLVDPEHTQSAVDPKLTAERVAALVIAIRLMEMHLDLATPDGAGRDTIAWTVAQRRLTVLRELLAELRATQPEQPQVG